MWRELEPVRSEGHFPLEIMLEVFQAMPENAIQLRLVDYQAEGITIQGVAISTSAAVAYGKLLSQADFPHSWAWGRTEFIGEIREDNAVEFEIRAQLAEES